MQQSRAPNRWLRYTGIAVLLWVLKLMGIERLGLGLLGSISVRAFCAAIPGGAALTPPPTRMMNHCCSASSMPRAA